MSLVLMLHRAINHIQSSIWTWYLCSRSQALLRALRVDLLIRLHLFQMASSWIIPKIFDALAVSPPLFAKVINSLRNFRWKCGPFFLRISAFCLHTKKPILNSSIVICWGFVTPRRWHSRIRLHGSSPYHASTSLRVPAVTANTSTLLHTVTTWYCPVYICGSHALQTSQSAPAQDPPYSSASESWWEKDCHFPYWSKEAS